MLSKRYVSEFTIISYAIQISAGHVMMHVRLYPTRREFLQLLCSGKYQQDLVTLLTSTEPILRGLPGFLSYADSDVVGTRPFWKIQKVL